MVTVIVIAYAAFGFTDSEAKTEIMCLQTKYGGKCHSPSLQPTRCTNKWSSWHTWAGQISANRDLSVEVTRRIQRA